MAAEWYYTTNKTQMGPVSWKDLRELADVGILKPHDMVWTDGMAEWVKAINQAGLFAEEADKETPDRKRKSAFTETVKPPPARRTRPRQDDEDEEDEDEDRKSKKRNRQREEARAKAGVGIKVGLILGGVAAVLMFLVCAGVGLIWLSRDGGGRPIAQQNVGGDARPVVNPPPVINPPPVVGGQRRFDSFTVRNLAPGRWEEKTFNFQQGKRMLITVTTAVVGGRQPDVDLFIHRGNGPRDMLVTQDISIGPNSRIEFMVPANDVYRVRVGNHGPGFANISTVNIVEQP